LTLGPEKSSSIYNKGVRADLDFLFFGNSTYYLKVLSQECYKSQVFGINS